MRVTMRLTNGSHGKSTWSPKYFSVMNFHSVSKTFVPENWNPRNTWSFRGHVSCNRMYLYCDTDVSKNELEFQFWICLYKSFGTWIGQFLDGTSGWTGVPITKFFTIKSLLFQWLFWVWDILGTEWESFWTRSDVHTSLLPQHVLCIL